jgi:hypothetical protein
MFFVTRDKRIMCPSVNFDILYTTSAGHFLLLSRTFSPNLAWETNIVDLHLLLLWCDTPTPWRGLTGRLYPRGTYLLAYLLMELSPYWRAANSAATQEFPSILWNPKVHYRVHKSPPLSLSWATLIQSHPISLRFILILSTPYAMVYPVFSVLLAFPQMSYMHASSLHSCYMPCPPHPPRFDHSNYTWRRVQVMELLTMP